MSTKHVREVLDHAGIGLNGSNPWDIHVHDQRWYQRVWRENSLGLGESYMDGWWDCERLDEMFYRLLRAGLKEKFSRSPRYLLHAIPGLVFNLQSKMRSRIVAEHHYDLGIDLFGSFLDPYKQYSCGFFQNTDDLNQAQQNKLALIAKKLDLQPGDHVLDIGCGWGGLARYAAEHYNCNVTAVNISEQQLQHAKEKNRGLSVDFLNRDYRSIDGTYDKVVSVGMFEHVGRKNYQTFMRVAHDVMKDEGVFLLHTIGSNISRVSCDQWITKYIFPCGMLPSITQIGKAAEGRFVIEDLHNFGPHYDKTLMAWNRNFQAAWPTLRDRYDQRFKRMWEYYLLSCAGAFRARQIQLWQVVMTKNGSGRSQPSCRDDNLAGFPGVRDAAAPPQEEPRPFRPPESVQPMQ
ncbi:cyclopropane fatty acyl phospholipid synthase [Desulfonatronum thioautotrophicum]|uniref:cyclopropane fatty acyl phospholipid synthase n=1 Tax=Desulfonatronum thioautotrophicum TaxID=617001 RepID=UPI0009FDC946|nr:cyclopropane fatty acyl phospholipid synthase [Desulfonatronum thioautotrophicum]